MIRVVIIEDEQIASDYLEKMIRSYSDEFEVIAKLDSVEASIKFLSDQQADLLFCDIHLADDISFNIFNQITVTAPVIFTTAYDQYAIRAFKLNSIDYLLKPINKDELFAAITKFKQSLKYSQPDLSNLLAAFRSQSQAYQQRFLVSNGAKLKSVAIHEIAYFYADQKLNFLVEKSGKQFIVDHSLDKLEPQLDPELFFRINRQFIISFESISSMVSYSKSRIKVELQPPASRESIVSVERSPEFKIWLNQALSSRYPNFSDNFALLMRYWYFYLAFLMISCGAVTSEQTNIPNSWPTKRNLMETFRDADTVFIIYAKEDYAVTDVIVNGVAAMNIPDDRFKVMAVRDDKVTEQQIKNHPIYVVGTKSNLVLNRINDNLPIRFIENGFVFDNKTYKNKTDIFKISYTILKCR